MKKHSIPFKKFFYGFIAVVGLWGAFSVPTAFAVSQLIHSASNSVTLQSTTVGQTLGTGLSGSISNVVIHITPGGSGSTDFRLYLVEYTGSNYATTTATYESTVLNLVNDVEQDVVFDFSTPVVLDSSKYYSIQWSCFSSCAGDSYTIWGSSSSVYTNGNSWSGSVPSTTVISGLDDLFFVLNESITTTVTSVFNLSPVTSSTTASTNVNFSFKYNALSSDSINSYKIYIKDVNTPTPILSDFTIIGSASTGSNVLVSRYQTLISGHAYYWWVDLCSATRCYTGGPVQTFSVVTPFYLNPSFNAISSTSTVLSGGLGISTSTLSAVSELDCGVLDILDGTCIASVFSYLFIPSTAVIAQFTSLGDLLATKIPFSYVYAIEDAANNIELTTTQTEFPLISIPLSSVASSTVTGVIPDIEMTTSTISTYLSPTFHNALYALVVAAIWLNVGWLFFREAMRIFKS